MGTYNELSQSDKAILNPWQNNFRGWLNELARMIISARALKASMDASGGAGEILDSLDVGSVVPNTGGIKGAQDFTKEEAATLRSAGLNTFLTNYDTVAVRALIAKAAGPLAGV